MYIHRPFINSMRCHCFHEINLVGMDCSNSSGGGLEDLWRAPCLFYMRKSAASPGWPGWDLQHRGCFKKVWMPASESVWGPSDTTLDNQESRKFRSSYCLCPSWSYLQELSRVVFWFWQSWCFQTLSAAAMYYNKPSSPVAEQIIKNQGLTQAANSPTLLIESEPRTSKPAYGSSQFRNCH